MTGEICGRATEGDGQSCGSLCRPFTEMIKRAGGAELVQGDSCPVEAVLVIAAGEGKEFTELRRKLGIVGVVKGELE